MAEREKMKGNECVGAGDYDEAISHYTAGLEICSSMAALWANRCMCYLKKKKWALAETDANKALELDPKYIKAYSRRGSARMARKNVRGAILDYETGLSIDPTNQTLRKQLDYARQKAPKPGFQRVEIKQCDDSSDSDDGDIIRVASTSNDVDPNTRKGSSSANDADDEIPDLIPVETSTEEQKTTPVEPCVENNWAGMIEVS